MNPTELAERLRQRSSDVLEARDEVSMTVAAEDLTDVIRSLADDPDLAFRFLSDITAADWPGTEPRFWLAYHLLSMEHRMRVRVKVGLPADRPRVASLVPVFAGANWLEREVYDFFGVIFEGHPDLRRIEMPEDWEGHPLRKDEPLAGVNTRYKGAFVPPPDQRGW